MTYKNFGRALTLLAGFGFAACGGSTTINFVGEEDGSGGEGGEGTGGNDGDGGGDGDGGMGGDAAGGTGTGGGSGGQVIVVGYCGDGSIDDTTEDCDDGNERSRDGCSSTCVVEDGFNCDGEPSECTPTLIGNGVIDPGEECDDGNVQNDDGCSSSGAIEGTCEEPEGLEFVDNGAGTARATVTANTSAGGGTAIEQACGGFLRGAANDRTYHVQFDRDHDLTIEVESDFDAVVRIYGSYGGSTCDPNLEAFCIDDVGAGEVETFHYRRMPAEGEIVITVDGAEEAEEGEFTLTVTQGCDVEHMKLHRLTPFQSGGNTSVVSLKNLSDYCTVDLDRVGLTLTDDFSLTSVDLPEQGLPPHEVFRGSFDVVPSVNPNSFDFAETPGAFDHVAAGAYLCNGPCDHTGGTNVLDGLLTGTLANVEIPGTTFSPGPQDVGSSPYESHVRVAYDGVAPTFLASDWSPAFLIDPDDYTFDWFGYYNDATGALPPLEFQTDAAEGTIVSIPENAGTSTETTYATFSTYAAAIPAVVGTATYISYKVRTGNPVSAACYTSFGVDNGGLGTSTGWGDNFDLSLGYDIGSGGWYFQTGGPSYGATDVWHTVELENINWTNHTLDIRYDGEVFALAVSMNDTALAAVTLFSVMPHQPPACYYSDIIVRNGPPGRIWESPPVLIAPD